MCGEETGTVFCIWSMGEFKKLKKFDKAFFSTSIVRM